VVTCYNKASFERRGPAVIVDRVVCQCQYIKSKRFLAHVKLTTVLKGDRHMATLDLQQSVYELVTAHPEVADVLYEIGLKDIKNPAILNTMGRFMTIPKGAAMKKVPLAQIVAKLEAKGFEVINDAGN
jgi:hypothetical protein